MDRTLPALRAHVESVLLADREVELAFEGMQQQVHLIHNEARGAVHCDHLEQGAQVHLHARVLLAPCVTQHIHLLEQLELDGLDGGGGAQHDAAVTARLDELLDGAPCELT